MIKLLASILACHVNQHYDSLFKLCIIASLVWSGASIAMATNHDSSHTSLPIISSVNSIESSPLAHNILSQSISDIENQQNNKEQTSDQDNNTKPSSLDIGYRFTGNAVVKPSKSETSEYQDDAYQDLLSGRQSNADSWSLFAISTSLQESNEPLLLEAIHIAPITPADYAQVKNVDCMFKNTSKHLAPSSNPKSAVGFDEVVSLYVYNLQKSSIQANANLGHFAAQANQVNDQYQEQIELNKSASLKASKPQDTIDLQHLDEALTHDHNEAQYDSLEESLNLEQIEQTLNKDDHMPKVPAFDPDYTAEFMVDQFVTHDDYAQIDNMEDIDNESIDENTLYSEYDEHNDSEESHNDRVYAQKDRIFYNASNPTEGKAHLKLQIENQEHASKDQASKSNEHVQYKGGLEKEIANSSASNITKSVLGAQFLSEKSLTIHSHDPQKQNLTATNKQTETPAQETIHTQIYSDNFDSYNDKHEDYETYESYEEVVDNSKNRIYYTGTKNPKDHEDALANAILGYKNNQENNDYHENSHYGNEEIDVDPSVNLEDFKAYKDEDTTFFYQVMNDGSEDSGLLSEESVTDSSDNSFNQLHSDNNQGIEDIYIHNQDNIYRQNILDYDLRTYGANATSSHKDIITYKDTVDHDLQEERKNGTPYWQNNSDWEVKKSKAQSYEQLQSSADFSQSKEEAAIYGDFSLDISTHHDDYIDDIDESKIADYVIATNEEGESPLANRVLTRTRITSYALRFSDNPFLPIDALQREQTNCINGKGYSCYLVGRHYDGLASLGRNNKRRIIAASELAKAHELYPHIAITGADFDHLLHTIVFFRRGCHLNHSLSCRLLLSSYGRFGGLIALGKTTVKNKNLGVRYLEAGCHFEEPRSCANLAAMHLNGYSNFKPDSKQGISLYVRSCRIARTITNELRVMDPNLGIGCLELGRMYLNSGSFKDGVIIEKDYVKAHHYLHHACSLRSAAACQMLKDNFTNHEHIDLPMPIGETYRQSGNMNKRKQEKSIKKEPSKATPLNLYLGQNNNLSVFNNSYKSSSQRPILRHDIGIQP